MKTMTIFFLFLILIFSITLISSTSKGSIMGLLNQSGFVHYTLTHFNDTSTTINISLNQGYNDSINLYLPKNATVLSALMNISGITRFDNAILVNTLTSISAVSISVDSNRNPAIIYSETGGNLYYSNKTGNIFGNILIDASGILEGTRTLDFDSYNNPNAIYRNGSTLIFLNRTGVDFKTNNITMIGGDIGGHSLSIDSSDVVHILFSNTSDQNTFNLTYGNKTGNLWNFLYLNYSSISSSKGKLFVDSNMNIHIVFRYDGTTDFYYLNKTQGEPFSLTEKILVTTGGDSSDLFIDSNRVPHICVPDDSPQTIYYANKTGSWKFRSLTSDASFNRCSIVMENDGDKHIIFEDITNKKLRYHHTKNGIWQTEINLTTFPFDFQINSMTIDSFGDLHISYSDTTEAKVYYLYKNNYPLNISIDVNGTSFFNNTGTLKSSNITQDFSMYLQSSLSQCISNPQGFCNIDINISSVSTGLINLYNIEINYTYNITPQIETSQFTNKTYNFTPFTLQSILRKFKIPNLFPTTELNITGFFIDDSATDCIIDGVSRPRGTNAKHQYCNLSTSQILNSSGGDWTNHTVFDGQLGTYSPVNLTNSSQVLNSSRERIRYFNITSYLPNGSIANDTLGDIIYNITVQINLTDTDLPNRTQGYEQGIRWFNGSDYVGINISNRCTITNNIYEDNYTYTLNAGLNFSGCYNDTNNNDIWDYFKVLVPKLSQQQFYVYGQEDTKNPNATIIQPTGSKSSTSISFTINVTDDVGLDLCYYNSTNSAETVTELAKTTFTCGNLSGNFSVTGDGNYVFNLFSNDTSGNINITSSTFSVSVPVGNGGNGGGGGGGGGGTTILSVVNQTNVTITEFCNKNGICEGEFGEDFVNCPSDCKFSAKSFLCDDPAIPCFWKNALIARIVMFLLLPLSLFIIILPPAERKRIKELVLGKERKVFK